MVFPIEAGFAKLRITSYASPLIWAPNGQPAEHRAAKRPSCRTAKLPTDQAAKRPNYQGITLNAHKRAGLLGLGYWPAALLASWLTSTGMQDYRAAELPGGGAVLIRFTLLPKAPG